MTGALKRRDLAPGSGRGSDPFYTKKGWIASATFLFLILMSGVVLAFTGGSGATITPKRAAPVYTGGSVCGLPAGSQDPVVGPPNASWDLVGTIAAPSAPGIGPGVMEHNDRRCFAHSPIGALFAAANVDALMGLPDGALSKEDSLRHAVPSRTRDVLASQPAAPVDPSIRIQVAGFRVAVNGRDDVTVVLALRLNVGAVGSLISDTMIMHWMDGDWRVRLGSIGEPFTSAPLTDLSGFIRWAGA